jgi:hypothetical protein
LISHIFNDLYKEKKVMINKQTHRVRFSTGMLSAALLSVSIIGGGSALRADPASSDTPASSCKGGYAGIMGGAAMLSAKLNVFVDYPHFQDDEDWGTKNVRKWQGTAGLYGGYLWSLKGPYVLGLEGFAAFHNFSYRFMEPGNDGSFVSLKQKFSGGLLVRGGISKGPWLFTLKAGAVMSSFSFKSEEDNVNHENTSKSKTKVAPAVGFDIERTFQTANGMKYRIGFGHLSTFYPKVSVITNPVHDCDLRQTAKSPYNAQFVLRVGIAF